MATVLRFVAHQEQLKIPDAVLKQIIEDANGNMRKAILVMEALRMQSWVWCLLVYIVLKLSIRSDFTGSLAIAKPDWETYCHKVADLIVTAQSPARIMEVRSKFYELLSHCIPPTTILKVFQPSWLSVLKYWHTPIQTVAERVVERVDESLKPEIMHWAAFYVSVLEKFYLAPQCTVFHRKRGCGLAIRRSTI